jgi:hypothetical protein
MYTVNPCKACLDTHGCDANINTINNCVAETTSAYSGLPTNTVLRTGDMHNNWKECIMSKIKGCGRTRCDFRLDIAPVFNNGAHFFPTLMTQIGNKEQALNQCIAKCSMQSNKPETCKENCMIDARALEEYSGPSMSLPTPSPVNKSNVAWMMGIGLGILLVILVMWLVFKK